MEKLVHGTHQFRTGVFLAKLPLVRQTLAEGQRPLAMMITCSDSRVDPEALTQADPGELFVLRNAGNIVPPFGATRGGEAATVEYAVNVLGVRDLIVCGHSHCGAMQALVNPATVDPRTAVGRWLEHAEATRQILWAKYPHLDGEPLVDRAVRENVLVQLGHLGTHPAVAAGLARRELRLHGWVLCLDTGTVDAFDPGRGRFVPLNGDAGPGVLPPPFAPLPLTAGEVGGRDLQPA